MKREIKVAIIDMYENIPNQGMRCIKQLLDDSIDESIEFEYTVFNTRVNDELPGLNYDVYISTGGPGSPISGEGQIWQKKYKEWIDSVDQWNKNHDSKKSVLLICFSFQLVSHLFQIADVVERKSTSFGITPIHKTEDGKLDPLYQGLSDPFYAADFRDWQVIQPNRKLLDRRGFKILSLEKIRPHVPLERAITGIRLSEEIVGVQFHPEADALGMHYHFSKEDQKNSIIKNHGKPKYEQLLNRLEKKDYIEKTYKTVIPNFLRDSVTKVSETEAIL